MADTDNLSDVYILPNCNIVSNSTIDFATIMLSDKHKLIICQNLLINTDRDYRCIKNITDKPISDVLPINRCITMVKYVIQHHVKAYTISC